MLRLFKILTFCAFVAPVLAQTDSAAIERKQLTRTEVIEGQLPEDITLVTASRSGKKLSDLPITAFVITKEEIRRKGYTSLTDVMKAVPGVRISRPGSAVLGEMFMMRGLIGNTYTKILINSVPIQPSTIGGLPLGEQLPIAQAEAIEIIYGPAASVYGADAMAGVINIITQTPSKNSTLVEGNLLTGNNGYLSMNFLLGGKVGESKNTVEYSVYGNFAERRTWALEQHTEEGVYNTLRDFLFYLIEDPEDRAELTEFARAFPEIFVEEVYQQENTLPFYKGGVVLPEINDQPHQSYLVGGTVRFRGFQADIQQMYRRDHNSLGLTPALFSHADPSTFTGEYIQRYRLGYKKDWNRFSLTTNLSYLRYRTDSRAYQAVNYNNNNLGVNYIFGASDDLFGEAILVYRPSRRWEITLGGSRQQSSVLPTSNVLLNPSQPDDYRIFSDRTPDPQPILGTFGFYPQQFSVTGLFAQGFFDTKRWTLTFGLRYEQPSNYDVSDNFFSRIAALYKLSNRVSLRLTGGSAFKSPSPDITYGAFASPFPAESNGTGRDLIGYELIPNPDLEPEQLTSSELGVRIQLNPKVYLEFATYSTTLNQQITVTAVPLDTTVYRDAISSFTSIGTLAPGLVRAPLNDEDSRATQFGFQFIARFRDLFPSSLKLNTDFYLTLTEGEEILPSGRGRIDGLRLVPPFFAQWNLDFKPTKAMDISIEQTLSGKWFRRFIPIEEVGNSDRAKQNGFYNIDLLIRYQLGTYTTAFIKTRNLLNARYAGIGARGADVDMLYNPQVGRNFQIGFSFKR
ncbi:MAG: TonB-dependent receptor [Bacteroidota bacterium]